VEGQAADAPNGAVRGRKWYATDAPTYDASLTPTTRSYTSSVRPRRLVTPFFLLPHMDVKNASQV